MPPCAQRPLQAPPRKTTTWWSSCFCRNSADQLLCLFRLGGLKRTPLLSTLQPSHASPTAALLCPAATWPGLSSASVTELQLQAAASGDRLLTHALRLQGRHARTISGGIATNCN
eukprot:scaffold20_cov361-Prasinococcus_capsulatus_cf.AAC.9